MCSGFKESPSICQPYLNSYTPDFLPSEDGIKPGIIVAIVIGLILFNAIIVYCYRRQSKREMQGEMQMQIESAVSQYFALSQSDGRPYVK